MDKKRGGSSSSNSSVISALRARTATSKKAQGDVFPRAMHKSQSADFVRNVISVIDSEVATTQHSPRLEDWQRMERGEPLPAPFLAGERIPG